ncbi:hypothetical protein C797_11971 [Bacillus thuringiensis Sbt003]|uniref:Uncharacterized protein n=1 Tax=Bacillus thuringiensis Sbt003 TaxID=1235825 RepID=A0A9X0JZ93_BACTU|nr:hypothetical protein [Bacillus thuringiensis]KIU74657.1 hypothetical protein C797_11971 [Bacillus thuringiensis Sbt003]
MNYNYADGNTGYHTREPAPNLISVVPYTGGHHIDEPGVGWKYAHGNGGGDHREPGGHSRG